MKKVVSGAVDEAKVMAGIKEAVVQEKWTRLCRKTRHENAKDRRSYESEV
ncbi:hypothetical protein [Flavihumibacter petaseus]|nr:hypothetical protein [Flavihumibacter petaseus]